MATSSASSRPTTKAWRSTRISAASRSAWRSTAHDNLYVCIGGMGLYRITPDRKVEKATDETNRSLRSVNDDSRLRLADDLDIADDGRIFFSEATVRYEMHEWPVDGLEARGNGRIVCYDPRNGTTRTVLRGLKFPNGICVDARRPVDPVRRDLGLLRQALLVRRPEDRSGRDGDGEPPGLPRQHQPGVRRKLLAGHGRHALTGARSCLAHARLPPPHGQARADRRMALPQHQHRLRSAVQREGRGPGDSLGSGRRQPSHDHLDARAQGLSLSRRHQNNRIGRYKLDGADPGFVQYDRRWGKSA